MKISIPVVLSVNEIANGQFMGGWISAKPAQRAKSGDTRNGNTFEIEYSQSWLSMESGYARGCSEDDIFSSTESQVGFTCQLKSIDQAQFQSNT